MGGVGN